MLCLGSDTQKKFWETYVVCVCVCVSLSLSLPRTNSLFSRETKRQNVVMHVKCECEFLTVCVTVSSAGVVNLSVSVTVLVSFDKVFITILLCLELAYKTKVILSRAANCCSQVMHCGLELCKWARARSVLVAPFSTLVLSLLFRLLLCCHLIHLWAILFSTCL